MSSNDSMGIVFKCLSKGAVDFLVKPIRKNELKNLWQHVWRKCHSVSHISDKFLSCTQALTAVLCLISVMLDSATLSLIAHHDISVFDICAFFSQAVVGVKVGSGHKSLPSQKVLKGQKITVTATTRKKMEVLG